jgi:uncharacterized protein YbaP (TraB family)
MTEPQVASLSSDQLKRLQTLEQEIGQVYLIAYEAPVVPATLSPEQLRRLEAAEQELGVCLVAYQK